MKTTFEEEKAILIQACEFYTENANEHMKKGKISYDQYLIIARTQEQTLYNNIEQLKKKYSIMS